MQYSELGASPFGTALLTIDETKKTCAKNNALLVVGFMLLATNSLNQSSSGLIYQMCVHLRSS